MRNLEPGFYFDPAVFRREQERVFWRAWQLLGPASQVANAGDYVAAEIAGAKVVAIRGDDGVLRAFRNVCVHRGARLLEEGTGHCSAIQCPYHRWLYGLDGTLKRTPWFGEDRTSTWPIGPCSRSASTSGAVCCSWPSIRSSHCWPISATPSRCWPTNRS